jgi:hypothetical protein
LVRNYTLATRDVLRAIAAAGEGAAAGVSVNEYRSALTAR